MKRGGGTKPKGRTAAKTAGRARRNSAGKVAAKRRPPPAKGKRKRSVEEGKWQRRPPSVTPDLEAEIDKARELLSRTDAADAGVRYEVAEIVQRVMADPEKYGKKGVAKLGKRVGLGKRVLYLYARVPEVWGREEFDRIKEDKNELGRPLSWMHFLELSAVEDEGKREDLRQTALADNQTSRQVHRAITGGKTKPKDTSLSALLAGGSRRMNGLAEVLRRFHEAVEQGDEDVTEVDVERANAFRAALFALDEVREAIREHVERLPAAAEDPAADDEQDGDADDEPRRTRAGRTRG